MTGILNTLIMSKALKLDSLHTFLVFGLLNFTFMISSLDYKIHRKMYFGLFSNPTESVVLSNIIVIIVGYVGKPIPLVSYVFLFIFIGNCITNVMTSVRGFRNSKYKQEKLEVVINFLLILLVVILRKEFLNDNPNDVTRKVLYYVCYSLVFHIASLNYIAHEILLTHCDKKNMIVLCLAAFPLILPFSVEKFFMYFLIGGLIFYACLVWNIYTTKICRALKMNHFWSVPEVGNNPFSE